MSSAPPEQSETASSTHSSPYRIRRQSRRDALDRILKNKGRLRQSGSRENSSSPLRLAPPQDQPSSRGDDSSSQRGSTTSSLKDNLVSHHKGESNHHEEGATVTTASMDTACTLPAIPGYAALPDDSSPEQHTSSVKKVVTEDAGDAHQEIQSVSRRNPQHLETHEEEESDARYYRIVYQGVVGLLSEPHRNSAKSGAYVSYGECIMSRHEVDVEDEDSTLGEISPRPSLGSDVGSPPQSVLSQNAGSVSSLDTSRTASTAAPSQITQSKSLVTSVTKRLIRVDEVLTGGYAVDASDAPFVPEQSLVLTPKRSNLHYVPMVGPSPLPLSEPPKDDSSGVTPETNYGYLFTRKRHVVIAERLAVPPVLQTGTFLFKIVSAAPLPILTGPCVDAPKTRAVLLPGTVHEVCLKMTTDDSDVCFLRLSHRRGWIADRRVTSLGGILRIGAVPATKEVTGTIGDTDDITVTAMSLASTSIASTSSSVRRRHRPPRRKRQENKTSGLPRHVGGQTNSPARAASPRRKPVSPNAGRTPDKFGTPSSNVSLLSDEESFDLGSQYRFPSGLTPDRSLVKAKQQARASLGATFFLMQVNAPRGLKILDAPHFQVSSLIHGKSDAKNQTMLQVSGTTSPGSKGTASSIFQTMAAPHTAKATVGQVGNPAVFDSVSKTRVLPRGVMFEASKRMEASGAFNRGAGLIKLSDNSGWAIVPRQDELDAQYRNYQGGVANVKEGEATRAFEEVGNAIVDSTEEPSLEVPQSRPVLWVRVVAKNGITVSCPPPVVPVAKDDDTSPTSSAGGSSIVSAGGSNYGILSGPDSDVASSVGSAFLDAMFRTPKKRDPHSMESRTHHQHDKKDRRAKSHELQAVPNILPCGSCVEVELWEDAVDDARPGTISQDYVRLRGGQGWIPLQLAGKTVSAVIPKPDIRIGSFWFRVASHKGIKVRLGPSRKAGSIKSDEGIYFRFECGEFLRASEVVTVFHDHGPSESFAKLYRNRHVRLNQNDGDYRQLISLTTPAEWVQVHSDNNIFLEECDVEPQISRQREGWRYNVVADVGVSVRMGPSFDAEATGVSLLVGESVLVTERVTAPGENIAWLRLKDGEGWVYESDGLGRTVMIAHSLRHRTHGRPQKAARPEHEEIAYNSIVARLFHEGIPVKDDGLQDRTYST